MLGNIHPVQRVACPHCQQFLDERAFREVSVGEYISCYHCGGVIKVSAQVIACYQEKAYEPAQEASVFEEFCSWIVELTGFNR